ncbi:hypothetical protein O0L34_g4153 [Tuta absoluta]|nr:hypothetical protein O0L34_g4153 [Tuta absoluta]
MNNQPSTSKQNVSAHEDEVFEDSTILANFNNSSFREANSRISENYMNRSLNKSGFNVSALCCDEEISGYDKLTGQTWIYPTNYPVRDYQFNIIKAAILKNTLVSLPTGLGKTFIAAVIMYNFYRWYPLGKIVFTAPTRPLVAQQIDACYNIVAIPQSDTIEMTGHMQATTRKTHWQTKRVFFATPQVIYNDIKSGICPANRLRCLVIDEAHRARGNYAYCQIVGTLTDMGHKTYRVLALSATPGSKVEDVIQVVKNLHIAHLELRTENCIDVSAYSHARRVSTVVIPLGAELTQLRQHYVEIMDGYARRLKQLNILPHNLGNLSKGRIVMLYKEFQNKERGSRHPQHNYIMKDFTLLIALYHGLELLVRHGSRVFLNFFDEHPEKGWIQADDQLTALLERLRDDLGDNPLSFNTSVLPDGNIPEMPQNLNFGHPKFVELKKIMLDHFSKSRAMEQDTRAIVFCEYRESVNLVHCLLLQCRPLIVPQMFVGQGASGKDGKAVVSQKQQLRVMRSFREGGCNTLVATCVAEEGLDVGSVDLIICFDISTRSPIRLVQRLVQAVSQMQLLRVMRSFREGGCNTLVATCVAEEGLDVGSVDLIICFDISTRSPIRLVQRLVQSSSQKQQLRVMRSFREGGCNTLVATCVAEEGLDVGSVDLIICFDISTRSPIRLVQRCGRTGRERGGQVHILVTEGREHQTLLDCMRQRDGLNKKIQQSREVQASLYPANPRMVPHDFVPTCQKMHITVTKTDSKKDGEKSKKGQKDLRSMLLGSKRASSSGSNSSNNLETNLITEEEFKQLYPDGMRETSYFEQPKEYWIMSKATLQSLSKSEASGLNLSTWLEWQRTLQSAVNIRHSAHSEILSSLLQHCDAKRFQLPASTQNPSFATQDFASQRMIPTSPIKTITNKVSSPAKIASPAKPKQTKKKKNPLVKSPVKKDGDIRALFSTATKSTKNYTKLINDLGIKNDGSIPTALINLLVDLSINSSNTDAKKCYVCENMCDCALIKKLKPTKNMPITLKTLLKEPKLPDIDLIDDIAAEAVLKCTKKDSSLLDSVPFAGDVNYPNFDNKEHDLSLLPLHDSQDVAGDVSYLNVDKKEQSKNFELEFDFDSPIDLTSPGNNIDEHKEEKDDKNFDIGDIDDIFADSSPEEVILKNIDDIEKKVEPKEALGFFGLDSIDDIFADSDDSLNNNVTKTPHKARNNTSKKESPLLKDVATPGTSKTKLDVVKDKSPIVQGTLSPSILSGRAKPAPTSPILCSQVRKFKLSTKKKQPQSSTPNNNVKRCLMPEVNSKSAVIGTQGEKSKSIITQISQMDTTNRSMFTITQLVDMINKTGEKSLLSKSNTKDNEQISKNEDERCTSPILLTQADKKKINPNDDDEISSSPILLTQAERKKLTPNLSKKEKVSIKNITNTSTTQKKAESLIILESDDSESENEANDTQLYDVEENFSEIHRSQKHKTTDKQSSETSINISPSKSKRKSAFLEDDDDEVSASPYFNKRQKLQNDPKKLSLKQKVLAALTSNKIANKPIKDDDDDSTPVNFMVSPIISSQKENKKPLSLKNRNPETDKSENSKDEYIRRNNLSMLQMFRRDSNMKSPKARFESFLNSQGPSQMSKKKLTFEDSDDDFTDAKSERSKNPIVNGHRQNDSITNHKVRKKKRKPKNEFLDLEADLSGAGSDSGDELSDDSVGSIIDFICDEDVTHRDDMMGHYIRSVKSPVKGMFKIPELPRKFAREDVFSQFVPDEDNQYEMDSFCVDSHIELTQANDMTELEVAEMLLEEKRRKKKRARPVSPEEKEIDNDDSPLVRKRRNVKRKIQSDSDDSS